MKVGRFTVAISLIAAGTALALDNMAVTESAGALILKLWPLILIGFGLEYLWVSRLGEARDRGFDLGGAMLLLVILGFVFVRSVAGGFVGPFFPTILSGPFSMNVTKMTSVVHPASGVAELKVSTGVGRVDVRPGTDRIEVEATVMAQREEDLKDVQVKVRPGSVAEVYLEGVPAGRSVQASYVIAAPQGLRVQAQTGTGSIRVAGYNGELRLSSGTGRTEVEMGAGSLSVTGGTGSVSVRSFEGPVSVTASTGSLSVETSSPLAGDVRLRTGTGSITLEIPPSSVRVSARTGTGSLTAPEFVTVTKSGSSRRGSGTRGEGQYLVELEASTGSIRFRER